MNPENKRPGFWLVTGRALIKRCPNCGKGRMFKSYLKQVEYCSSCNEKLGHIRADDGPAWLTILLIGHILAPFMLVAPSADSWPDWLLIIILLVSALMLSIFILPLAKALFIAMIWRTKK